MKHILITISLMLTIATAAFAIAPPPLINYQGVLRDVAGARLSGSFDLIFRFFDDADPAAPDNELLVDRHTTADDNAVVVTDGVFNAHLGGGTVEDGSGPGTFTNLSEVFAQFNPVYLQVQVGDETFTSRIRVVSAAYALNAHRLDGLTGAQFLRSDASVPFSVPGGILRIDTDAGADLEIREESISRDAPNGSLLFVAEGMRMLVSINGDLRVGMGDGGLNNDYIYFNDTDALLEWLSWNATNGRFEFSKSVAAPSFIGSATALAPGNLDSTRFLRSDASVPFSVPGGVFTIDTGAGSDLQLTEGNIDFGVAANDDLTASDVSTLTGGGTTNADSLHTHDSLVAASGDTMTGNMTFAAGARLLIDDGTAANPAIALRNDTNTGLFGVADRLSLATNGQEGLSVTSTGDVMARGVFYPGNQTTQSLSWDATDSRFEFNEDLSVAANLKVDGTIQGGVVEPAAGFPYHSLRFNSLPGPASSEIGSEGDLFIQHDLEIGDKLEIQENLTGEHIGRIDGVNGSPDRLLIETPASGSGSTDAEIHIYATGAHVRFAADSNANTGQTTAFIWYNNGLSDTIPGGSRIMDISVGGHLRIKEQLEPDVGFDLAEGFFAGEPLEPGDLVRVSPDDPRTVLRAAVEGDPTVIGVVSTKPAIVLGGGAFTVEDLRRRWGDRLVALYDAERASLEAAALAAPNGLGERKRMLEATALAAQISVPPGDEGDPSEVTDTTGRDAALLADDLTNEMLRLFFERHFVPVTLSGRVPVKVEGLGGEIRPGDLLTPGPTPGVAVKAMKAGPVIGVALEALTGETGQVMALIHRETYTPPTDDMALGSVRDEQARLADELAARTPDLATGVQSVAGNLQVILDKGADDRSRFSISRDGEAGLSSEVFRVDEEGNVYAKGSFRPASLDLAEYHPVSEPVDVGDLLVVDRSNPGKLRKGTLASDPAVVGIVSAEPGVLMGGGITRIATVDPDLAASLDDARLRGDRAEEAKLWAQLEEKFRQTHAAVALSGTVACKVDADYGTIRIGDLLTTSPTPGHAMRSNDLAAGTIVGKAMEPLASGKGVIKVLVMLR